jgi:zinc protease
MPLMRPVRIWLIAIALAACALPFGRTGPGTADREGLMRTTLDNGMKVVLVEDRSAPVVALNVWVRAGSADETDAESGMAHVFEHMLFKGTERRAVGEIARSVEGAGGNINAFTSLDMTVYHITMASRDVATGIDVLADAIRHSTFDPDEFARETQVILEEIRRGQDSPDRVLFEEIFSTAYTTHPYRRPVIGTSEHVLSFTRDQMLDFHRRWYAPNNLTFVAAGDFDPEAVLEQVRTAFTDALPLPGLAHPRAAEPVQTAPRSRLLRRPFERTLVGIAWPASTFEHPDTAYLDLLAAVLGGGDSSRLYRNVKDGKQLVHGISASSYTPVDPGLFFVDAVLEPQQIEPALAAIGVEIDRITAFGPSEAELERARTNVLANQVREKETMQGQARKHGYHESLGRGIEAEEEYLDRVRRATVGDLQRVAREYLVAEKTNVVALVPEKERADLNEGALLAALASGSQRAEQLAPNEIAPGIRRYQLPNGLRVIVKRNPSVPLVALRLSFLGGQLAETRATEGVSSFIAEMLQRGTEQRSAAQLAAEVEDIAGSLDGFSGRNSFGLTGEFLKESLDTGLELFADALLHPSFPADEIEKLRREQIAAIRRREDNLASRAFELFADALHAPHPYSFPTMGTEKSVSKFDRATLERYYQTYATPANGVLGVVGDVDPDQLVEAIAFYLGGWKGPEKVALPARPTPPARRGPHEVALRKQKQQVHIVLGFPGLRLNDPDQPALEVLTQILSGQGGRLFLELRDKKSLAYTVSAFEVEGLDPGAFGVYIASAPEKREESLAGLRAELVRVLDEPIEPAEIERARAYLIGSHAVSLQSYALQASLLSLDELYGLGAAHHLEYAKRIEAVTVDDVRRVAQRLIHLDMPVIAEVR